MEATGVARQLIEPVPANRRLGIQVLSAVDGVATVAMDVGEFANVIGSMHASGLIGLLDAAGLAALLSLAQDSRQHSRFGPLGTRAELGFVAPGRGLLLGRTEVTEPSREAMVAFFRGDTDRARLETVAEIQDSAGTKVCTGRMEWSIRVPAAG